MNRSSLSRLWSSWGSRRAAPNSLKRVAAILQREPYSYHPYAVDIPPTHHTRCEFTTDCSNRASGFFWSELESEVVRSVLNTLWPRSRHETKSSLRPSSPGLNRLYDTKESFAFAPRRRYRMPCKAYRTALCLGGICIGTGWYLSGCPTTGVEA